MSTALMYSFGNREDCTVVDEPFYACYLDTHPDIDHPGRKDVLDSQSIDYNTVLKNVIFRDYNSEHVFFKNMAHHMEGTNWEYTQKLINILLIRNPRDLIASFARVISHPSLLDIGIKIEYDIMEYFISHDIPFVVIDSGDLRKNPTAYMQTLCSKIGIEFTDRMLKWKAGPRPEDGVWAPYWYANVHKSSGFSKEPLSAHEFPEHLNDLLDEAQDYYEKISVYKI